MKIKQTIKIAGKTYTVKFVESLADFGSTDFDKQVINIKAGISDEMTVSVLLHEIVEVVNFSYELGLKHQDITILENAAFQIIKDNF